MIWAIRALWSIEEELEEDPTLEVEEVAPESLDPELELVNLEPDAEEVEEVAPVALTG